MARTKPNYVKNKKARQAKSRKEKANREETFKCFADDVNLGEPSSSFSWIRRSNRLRNSASISPKRRTLQPSSPAATSRKKRGSRRRGCAEPGTPYGNLVRCARPTAHTQTQPTSTTAFLALMQSFRNCRHLFNFFQSSSSDFDTLVHKNCTVGSMSGLPLFAMNSNFAVTE